MSKYFFLTLASAAAAATLPTAALVAATPDAPSMSVRYTDLNLASDDGVSAFHQRVARAAEHVCGSYDIRDLRETAQARQCQNIAMTDAQPQMQVAIDNARGGARLASAAGSMTVRAR